MMSILSRSQLQLARAIGHHPSTVTLSYGRMHYYHHSTYDDPLEALLMKLRATQSPPRQTAYAPQQVDPSSNRSHNGKGYQIRIDDHDNLQANTVDTNAAWKSPSAPKESNQRENSTIPNQTIYVPPSARPNAADKPVQTPKPAHAHSTAFWEDEEPMASIIAARRQLSLDAQLSNASKEAAQPKPVAANATTDSDRSDFPVPPKRDSEARKQAIDQAVRELEARESQPKSKVPPTAIPGRAKPVYVSPAQAPPQHLKESLLGNTNAQPQPKSQSSYEAHNRAEGIKARFTIAVNKHLEALASMRDECVSGIPLEDAERELFVSDMEISNGSRHLLAVSTEDVTIAYINDLKGKIDDWVSETDKNAAEQRTEQISQAIKHKEAMTKHNPSFHGYVPSPYEPPKRTFYLAAERFADGIDGIVRAREAGFTVLTLFGKDVAYIGTGLP